MNKELEFHTAMVEIFRQAKQECGYVATRFLQMVNADGGVEAARRLLLTNDPSDGFTVLWEHGRLDLSVEAHMLRPEFADLFTDEERSIARKRLLEYGYTA